MDTILTLVLFGAVAVAIAFWLKKRKEPKETVFLPGPSQELWDATIEDLMRNTKAQLISIWSGIIIENGGTHVPPNLGQGMTKTQISEEIAALRLGGRPD